MKLVCKTGSFTINVNTTKLGNVYTRIDSDLTIHTSTARLRIHITDYTEIIDEFYRALLSRHQRHPVPAKLLFRKADVFPKMIIINGFILKQARSIDWSYTVHKR